MSKKYFRKQERKKNGDPKIYSDGRRKPTGLNPSVVPTFRVPDYERPTRKEEAKMTADVMASIIAENRRLAVNRAEQQMFDKDRFTKAEEP